ncbi:MAG: hypothetical protein Q8N53_07920 [Longimicrobiales bacterium]|nr:hypothetical protein [Longimicrobiales bacterium]
MRERPAARPGSVASFVPRRADVDALVRLALPVAMVTVSTMTMGVVDTIMVGRVSARDLAAVALGLRLGLGPQGVWAGLALGIAVVAILLLVRVWTRFGRDLRCLAIEDEHG